MSNRTRRGLVIIVLITMPFVVGLLFTYQVIKFEFPTDMADQPSIDYQEGPRMLPPEKAVAIQGKQIILDAPPVNPIPADEVSLQRGEILYSIHCALCHGETGLGDGPMEQHYSVYDLTPPDLTGSNIAFLFDGTLFRNISLGTGSMPPLAENLTPRERWDVVNYLRVLEISDEP